MKKIFSQLDEEFDNIDELIFYLRTKKVQIYYSTEVQRKRDFIGCLRKIKGFLISLKIIYPLDPTCREKIEDMLYIINDLEGNLKNKKLELVEEDIDHLRGLLTEARAYSGKKDLTFDIEKIRLPKQILSEIKEDIKEVQKCYGAEANRAALTFCGRILEIALSRKYFENTGIDPIEQKWNIGLLIRKCREEGILKEDPSINEFINLINKTRIPSVHKTKIFYIPSPEETEAIAKITSALLKRMFK